MAVTYQHRQVAEPVVRIASVVMVTAFIVVSFTAGATTALVAVAVPALLVAVLIAMFGSLNTQVDDSAVEAVWALGWPRRVIALTDIDHHGIVRNRWWYGLGVRWIPGGMLYAVWGLDAVEIRYRDGQRTRTFRIGTDDPHGLAAAIGQPGTTTAP